MKSEIIRDRMCAQVAGEPVLFLIGMRFNRPWRFRSWLPVFLAMPKMMKELETNPDLGYLGGKGWFGKTILFAQYWESFEKLESYAKNRDHAHLPAWAEFNRRIKSSSDVGIWHETYLIRPGGFETMYVNMPTFGLGAAFQAVPAHGDRTSARGRLAKPTTE